MLSRQNAQRLYLVAEIVAFQGSRRQGRPALWRVDIFYEQRDGLGAEIKRQISISPACKTFVDYAHEVRFLTTSVVYGQMGRFSSGGSLLSGRDTGARPELRSVRRYFFLRLDLAVALVSA